MTSTTKVPEDEFWTASPGIFQEYRVSLQSRVLLNRSSCFFSHTSLRLKQGNPSSLDRWGAAGLKSWARSFLWMRCAYVPLRTLVLGDWPSVHLGIYSQAIWAFFPSFASVWCHIALFPQTAFSLGEQEGLVGLFISSSVPRGCVSQQKSLCRRLMEVLYSL